MCMIHPSCTLYVITPGAVTLMAACSCHFFLETSLTICLSERCFLGFFSFDVFISFFLPKQTLNISKDERSALFCFVLLNAISDVFFFACMEGKRKTKSRVGIMFTFVRYRFCVKRSQPHVERRDLRNRIEMYEGKQTVAVKGLSFHNT